MIGHIGYGSIIRGRDWWRDEDEDGWFVCILRNTFFMGFFCGGFWGHWGFLGFLSKLLIDFDYIRITIE